MKALIKTFVLLFATIGLASCGGGGGGSQGSFQPTPSDNIAISTTSSIPINSFTTITVTVTKHDGSIENDGTTINASVSPSTIGTVSGKVGTPAGTTASNTLAGGQTSFNFTSSNQAGTATIVISVPAGTNGSTTAATKSVGITVNAGNTQDPRLTITPASATLPLNPFIGLAEVGPDFVTNFLGSPYIAEFTVTWRHSNGQLVTGTSTVNVSIDPVTIAGFSQLDNPATAQGDQTKPDGNEFLTILGSGPINVTGGNGVIFVHSANVPGTAILTVTAIDPDNNQTISSQALITVAGAASSLPSSISASSAGSVYVSGSGGPQSTIVTALVTDGNGVQVPDPLSFDNVQFQILGPASDARLSGINAAGQAVVGTTVNTVTHSGVAAVTFQAGSQQGPVQVKVTADRADNNVDNGIQDPVSATITVVVSDGKLFTLTLTSPVVNAILVNRVSEDVTLVTQGGTIPPDPNATYSLTVSALGTDRQGNPVLPGTVIRFGAIDAPQSNGVFLISGVHGNPQEGGTLFTATDGHFKTAGGGAGPGDTLLVFGKDVPGNSDLESAAKVTVVNNETTLHVATPFNWNDTTGVSVDYGPVLPYIVGRAQTGNITATGTTNQFGVASTTLNYPVSALGRAVAIWAQGNSTDTVTGGPNIVTDAEVLVFPGVAPATIIISPNPIPGNITIPVTACIQDALESPISGVFFTFSFNNMGIGTGKLDGITGAGVVPEPTDASGCVTTSVTTTGIAGGATGENAPNLTFSAGSATASAPIVASGTLVLIANPSALGGHGGKVTLTLLNGNGTPVPGVQIVGTCEGDASIGLDPPPSVTDAQGKTTTNIIANLDDVGGGKTGSCTFTTATGSPSVTVTLKGIDVCLTSPQPSTCNPDNLPNYNLTVNLVSATPAGAGGYGSVSSSPSGVSCAMADAATPASCAGSFPQGTQVVLSVTLIPPATGVTWSQACASAGNSLSANVTLNAARTCTATFKP